MYSIKVIRTKAQAAPATVSKRLLTNQREGAGQSVSSAVGQTGEEFNGTAHSLSISHTGVSKTIVITIRNTIGLMTSFL